MNSDLDATLKLFLLNHQKINNYERGEQGKRKETIMRPKQGSQAVGGETNRLLVSIANAWTMNPR
jgi:hypothetical protein